MLGREAPREPIPALIATTAQIQDHPLRKCSKMIHRLVPLQRRRSQHTKRSLARPFQTIIGLTCCYTTDPNPQRSITECPTRRTGSNRWTRCQDLEPDDDPRSLTHYLEGDHGIPDGWIPIANSGYGDYTVLSVRSEDYGRIYYLFHEVHGYDASNRSNGVYPLANSFTEWIDGLDDLG